MSAWSWGGLPGLGGVCMVPGGCLPGLGGFSLLGGLPRGVCLVPGGFSLPGGLPRDPPLLTESQTHVKT